ncbi:DUF4998 domain-containing protein [Arcticibacter eurypsychrophilus]|uniref:DUF4998 domain-containing protein n=1 Tax=Arcticibacter eurypsychrophilus TaxID=1434752 RepID=UPI00084D7A3C|nr:DUF4998 domain-containing protein [Arcticibacter eurypsychrophilus]
MKFININRWIKQRIGLVFPVLIVMIVASCTKIDDYKKFAVGGEIQYTGKLDSVKVMSGKYRVLVKGLFIADPKVKKCVIYWTNKADSIVIPVTRTNNVDTLSFYIPNMKEGVQNFVIYTIDGEGNRSVAVYKTGRVYGDIYQASLLNRGINESTTSEVGVTTINFSGMDRLSGVFATEVIYRNNDDVEQTIRIPIESTNRVLSNFKLSTSIRYRTLFLPDTLSIDTFYTAYTERYVPRFIKTDITSTYLVNAGPKITASAMNGSRWGILAGWTSNASVKNFNGVGGYEFKSSVGVISMEAGWGLVNVPNGLIYQTIILPAGTYTFEVNAMEQSSGGSKYISVAAGAVLPDVANMTSRSIAFSKLDTKKLTFTLASSQQVSIGFGANLSGNSSTGQYLKIGNVRLYSIVYH